jgi:hypothetical protein
MRIIVVAFDHPSESVMGTFEDDCVMLDDNHPFISGRIRDSDYHGLMMSIAVIVADAVGDTYEETWRLLNSLLAELATKHFDSIESLEDAFGSVLHAMKVGQRN